MIYEYQCPLGHVTEVLSEYEKRETSVVCHCGNKARYRISAPHLDYYHMGVDPDLSTASDKWEAMHKQKLKLEQ